MKAYWCKARPDTCLGQQAIELCFGSHCIEYRPERAFGYIERVALLDGEEE